MRTREEIDVKIAAIRKDWRLWDSLKPEKREEILPRFNPFGAMEEISALEMIRWVLYPEEEKSA